MLKIRSFYPVWEQGLCLEYIEGHRRVLEDYGILNVTSYSKDWAENPFTYGVVAELDGKLVGGIRVQVADGVHPLPVETAVGKMDSQVYDLVLKHRQDGGTGELCGLWNAREVAGRGISILLVRAAISIINQLHFRTLLGICAEYSLPMFTRVGFVIDKTLGKDGDFIYPTEEYLAKVVGIMNAETLASSTEYDRRRMLELRANPRTILIETGPKGTFEVDYDLIVIYVNELKNAQALSLVYSPFVRI
ncbi:MAG: GNAT family N-acetyltransferase [Bacteroidia bacterium]